MLRLALKDLRLFLSDRRTVILGFLVPIALISLFAFAFGGIGQSDDEPRAVSLLIADEDQSKESKDMIARLDSLKEYEVWTTTTDSAETYVKKGDEAAVLVIRKGFGDSLSANASLPLEFEYDAAREAEVAILQGALTGNLMKIIGAGSMEKDAIAGFDRQYPDIPASDRERIHKQIRESFSDTTRQKQTASFLKTRSLIPEKQNSPGLIHAVAGTSIMMLLFSVVGMGASLLDEKEQGTLKRLLLSPIIPGHILLGKMIAVIIISMMQLVVMFIFAWLAFKLDITAHLLPLFITITATSYACASFGVVLASMARSRAQIQGLSTLIVLVMSCIGGSMIPTFTMPAIMQKFSVFSVNYWAVQSFYDIFWRMLPVTSAVYLERILVLVLIGTVLNTIAVLLFRKKRSSMV